MKIITFKITHDEVFNDLVSSFNDEDKERKHIKLDQTDPDNIVFEITGTLDELENEE